MKKGEKLGGVSEQGERGVDLMQTLHYVVSGVSVSSRIDPCSINVNII